MLENLFFESKQSGTLGLSLILFYHCPLRCSFCKQDQRDKKGMDPLSIAKKLEQVKEIVDNHSGSKIMMSIMGGEIFGDEVSDETLISILSLLGNINDYIILKGKTLSFEAISTSLILNNPNRVISFMKRLKEFIPTATLGVSYDKYYRFTGKTFPLFLKNLEIMEEHIDGVSFVLTKKYAQFLLSGEKDFFFEYLYSKFNTTFGFYSSNSPQFGMAKADEVLTPSDEEIVKSIKYLDKHYPKLGTLAVLRNPPLDKTPVKSSCNKSYVILPDGSLNKCCFKQDPKQMCVANGMKNECMSCTHFKYCVVPCMSDRFNPLTINNSCLMRKIYDYFMEQV